MNTARTLVSETDWATNWRENITILRDLWKATGRRPEELAFRLNVSKPTLQNWSHGGHVQQGPGLAAYANLRTLFGLDFIEPLTEDEIWEALVQAFPEDKRRYLKVVK
jgi:transcriptional regulator with XRE-family HTH domain